MSAAESRLEETRSAWLYARLAEIEPERRVAELFTALGGEASKQAVAPSLRPALLPAVTFPCARNGVLSSPRSSIVVPGRGGSSAVARPKPRSLCRVATDTRSGWNLPFCPTRHFSVSMPLLAPFGAR